MSAKNSGNQGRRSNSRRRKNQKKAAPKPEAFWGSAEQLPRDEQNATIATDPAAVVRSLGRPPLSGHHNVAEHYFTAVYDRAVTLASALAAAGDMIEPDELLSDGSIQPR